MMKIAEYLAAGRPVVAYRLGETVRTAGGAALLASCGDAPEFAAHAAALARDPSLRSELRARGLERSQALVWEHSAAELMNAYTELTA
jgi:glycosyltransferase involved in cell wall biosynthesis